MDQAFDPYRKWLGIPASDQPAHHYRLLGIDLFENDADVISNAADGRMAQVKNFQTGNYAVYSQPHSERDRNGQDLPLGPAEEKSV